MILHVIRSQYLAAMAMLRAAVVACPDDLWGAADDMDAVWHKAYHALFYTHLYLHPRLAEFRAWEKHREPEVGPPFSREEILEFDAFVCGQVISLTESLDFLADSGFDWLPMSKLELQIYSIRHIQQHAGELFERIGARTGVDLPWHGLGVPNN